MTAPPVRLKLSRHRGFDLRALSRATNGRSVVNCARPGKLGNPFIVGKHGSRAECVRLHALLLGGMIAVSVDDECVAAQHRHRQHVCRIVASKRMRGYNVACWCHGPPCHADNLLKVFNAEATS